MAERKGRCDECGGVIAPRSRGFEDLGFLVGIVNATLYTLGVQLGTAQPETWAVVALNVTLIGPKMLGRATAGRIWERIAGRRGSPQ